LGESDKKELAARPTQNSEAQSEYYKGRDLWEHRNKDNIREIMDHFEKAIARDASYAKPYAGLADCYVLLNMVSFGNMPTPEAMNKASVMALRALEIDPNLPEARTSLGVIRFKFGWNWPEAERELRRAIEINPDYAWAHYWLSHVLAVTGRWDEAIVEGRLASDLAPFSPQAGINECRALYYARQLEKAERCFLRLLQKWPGNESAQYVLAYVYLQKGMYPQAISILEKIYDHDKSLAAAPLGFAYGRFGNKPAALRILSELQKIGTAEVSKGRYLPPQEEALIYIGLGDYDQAFDRLETSYRERFASVIYLATDPIYDSLRADARFADLARRLNLTSVNPPG
jgi:tetratricopeptide (TPR) repeat protein